jgi:hypothetical protein
MLRKIGNQLERANNIFSSMANDIENISKEIEAIKYTKFCETGMTSVKLKKAIELDVELESEYKG